MISEISKSFLDKKIEFEVKLRILGHLGSKRTSLIGVVYQNDALDVSFPIKRV